ncbi:Metallo-dependent hydrolase [Trametes coccinea BRFM310]|uniref:Metallo-dependent hydrolase n=1 Tax=Trametes coccinea (strain BRFM310) TaxID=1353009 RepID=A0A1Y2J5A2_TRAC3|nr:Metallo-dependent hydrolase [Trametes coccinea BRFM310]
MYTLFYGALITPVSLTEHRTLPHALLAVERETGDIAWIEDNVPASSLQDVLARRGILSLEDVDLVELKLGEFLMPGFIDTHIHAPQVPNIGSGQQYELLDWLEHVTFPMEARFEDEHFARRAYTSVIKRTIDYGSTTCCYYGTLHLEGTKALAEVIHKYGQRAFVGKCNMDRNSPPNYVEPSAAASLAATRALIAHIRALPPPPGRAGEPLVRPILTPRFAISCSHELLAGLGALAAEDPALHIQTHISENAGEIRFTKELFPPASLPKPPAPLPSNGATGEAKVVKNGKKLESTYAGVYDAFGLLRRNTVLAHAVHLEDEEVEIIKAREAGISHCPTSNFNLRSGCARIGMLLDHGIKVSLGTDVSGGFSPSILSAVQHASMCSKVVATQARTPPPPGTRFTDRQLPVPTLLYLATQGGADVCDIGERVGSLAPGKAFDALVVSVRSDVGNPATWGVDMDLELGVREAELGEDESEEVELESFLERFLFCGDDRNVRRVYVQGRLIGGKDFGM